jgi:hypothetical protein
MKILSFNPAHDGAFAYVEDGHHELRSGCQHAGWQLDHRMGKWKMRNQTTRVGAARLGSSG